jgi:hypothetical protein
MKPPFQPGDHVRDRFTFDSGVIESVTERTCDCHRGQYLVCVRMDNPKVAPCEQLVATADDFVLVSG